MGVWKIDKKDSQLIKEAINKAFAVYGFTIIEIGMVIDKSKKKFKTYNAQKKYIIKILSTLKNKDDLFKIDK